jgi:DNA repair exonuclease SbcCD ATPase subunit
LQKKNASGHSHAQKYPQSRFHCKKIYSFLLKKSLIFQKEKVDEWVKEKTKTTPFEAIVQSMREVYEKYKFMESRVQAQKNGYLNKIPDIKTALEALQFLIDNKHVEKVETKFELADCMHMNAELTQHRTVYLWLGVCFFQRFCADFLCKAKVMLEYEYEEAVELLSNNLKSAETNLAGLVEELEFLKDQITITEVNLARLHNYSVAQKKPVSGAQAVKAQ